MEDRLTGYQQQVYKCNDCGALMNEEDIHEIKTLDNKTILPCIVCGSENIRLYLEDVNGLKLFVRCCAYQINGGD